MSERPAPRSDLFDQLWREIWAKVEEAIQAQQITMGTVVGKDGERVRVRLDEEDEDRMLGFPRSLGVAYDDGDRVPIGITRSGEPIVLPVVGGGSDRRVRNEQLDTGAVDSRAVKGGSISHTELTGGVSNEIKNALKPGDVKGSVSGNNKLITESAISNMATKSDVASRASQGSVKDLEERVKSLETKVKRLEQRVKKR